MTKHYEELPENLDQFSEEEIDVLAEELWLKLKAKEDSLDRNTRLRLRQQAYSIWISKYPHENEDDPDCHLESIYSWLLSVHFGLN